MSLEIATLVDESTGSRAWILPGLGFNCFRFQTVDAAGVCEVLWSAEGFQKGEGRPSGSGIPILFPFPGRIRGTEFHYQGATYALEAGDAHGNAIHGFVLNRPWEVVEQSPHRLVGRFHASKVEPDLLRRWPADFCITAAYELRGNTLLSELTIENPDERPLPWGLGTHPYFRLPLSDETEASQCRVTVPAGSRWELIDMLPTGKKLPLSVETNLAAGMAFGETQFDDVFSDLQFAGGVCATSIHDSASGRTMTMTFDRGFHECVVYNPPHREAVCIEPYTCLPGVFGEALEGKLPADVDPGVRFLQPGERFSARR